MKQFLMILLLCSVASVAQGQNIMAGDTIARIVPDSFLNHQINHRTDTLDVAQVVVIKHCKSINIPCPDAVLVDNGMYWSCSALHWKDTCWYEVVEKAVDTMPLGIGHIDLSEANRLLDQFVWRICDTIGRSMVDSTYPYYRLPNYFDPNELTNTEIEALREIIEAWRAKDLIRYSDPIRNLQGLKE